MKHTFEQRLAAGLKATGWQEDPHGRSRFREFKRHDKSFKFFVGPNGALRSGEVATRSYSIGTASNQTGFYRQVLAAGDRVLALEQPSSIRRAESIYG